VNSTPPIDTTDLEIMVLVLPLNELRMRTRLRPACGRGAADARDARKLESRDDQRERKRVFNFVRNFRAAVLQAIDSTTSAGGSIDDRVRHQR
jgi:hypothetical protein